MRLSTLRSLALAAAIVAGALWAADWPMPGGNPQRNGWAASERQITRANVRSLKLLYKYKTDNQSRGSNSLTGAIISGNLITYLGFKEMLMFAGSSDKVYSVDADLNRLIWEANLPYALPRIAAKPGTESCSYGLTSPVVMAGSSSNSLHFAALASQTPAANGVRRNRYNPYLPPLAESVYPLLPTTLTQLNALYAVSSDGYLHVLNSSTGQDLIPAVRFVPPEAKVTSLNLRDNIVYATTAGNCDGYRNALFALDILSPQKTIWSFVPPIDGFAGALGTSIGNDGTVYLQAAYPKPGDASRLYESVVALTPRELKVKDYFTIGSKPLTDRNTIAGVTPVVFSFTGRDLVIAGGADGKMYLLDSRSLGGPDHHTPLFETEKLVARSKKPTGGGPLGAISTWFDVESGKRRFYVTASGRLEKVAGLTPPSLAMRKPEAGVVLALELQGTSQQPTLKPLWAAGPQRAPLPPVIADNMLFVLSQLPSAASNGMKLQVLDAISGNELFSHLEAGAAASNTLALANGRLYAPGSDNAIYCFGIPAQQEQLFTP